MSYRRLSDARGAEMQALPLSVCSLLPISFDRINRDAIDVVYHPCLGHFLDLWDSRSYGFPEEGGSIAFMGFRVVGLNASIFTVMGSAFDMMEYIVRGGTRSVVLYGISCHVLLVSFAEAYISFRIHGCLARI